ncbi:MAG TPA: hypothetical protein VF230_17070 [Acidimicrobiales bacterium]
MMFETPTRTIDAPAANPVIRKVCGDCNNGWLAQLEAATAPILGPLVNSDGTRVVLSPLHQTTLARWAQKMVLIIEAVHEPDSPIDRAHYATFMRRRRPTENTVVLIAAYAGSEVALWYTRTDLHLPPTEHAPRPPVPNGYVATFNIFRFVFQVFGNLSPYHLSVTDERGPLDVVTPIWPDPQRPVRWPSGSVVDDDGLLGLHHSAGGPARFLHLPPPNPADDAAP